LICSRIKSAFSFAFEEKSLRFSVIAPNAGKSMEAETFRQILGYFDKWIANIVTDLNHPLQKDGQNFDCIDLDHRIEIEKDEE
jgi:hypothetical protein